MLLPASKMERRFIRQGGDNCAAIGCTNRRYAVKMAYFRFPKDPERCKKWVVNSKRLDLDRFTSLELYKNYKFCATHFEDSQFMNQEKKDRLIFSAVPTLFKEVPKPAPSDTSNRPLNEILDHSPAKMMKENGVDVPVQTSEPYNLQEHEGSQTYHPVTPQKKLKRTKLEDIVSRLKETMSRKEENPWD